jgi:hypothetical protein
MERARRVNLSSVFYAMDARQFLKLNMIKFNMINLGFALHFWQPKEQIEIVDMLQATLTESGLVYLSSFDYNGHDFSINEYKLSVRSVDDDSYYISIAGAVKLSLEYRVRMRVRPYQFRTVKAGRKLVVAASGSGKTYFVKNYKGTHKIIDADTLIHWPSKLNWWKSELKMDLYRMDIREQLRRILAQPGDEIILFADDLVRADAYVVIPEQQHKRNLLNVRPGQPGIGEWPGIEITRAEYTIKGRQRGILYDTFQRAIDVITSNGVGSFPFSNYTVRDTPYYMHVFGKSDTVVWS